MIENLAAIQASGGDTTKAPVVSVADPTAATSPARFGAQQPPATPANSTWVVMDTAPVNQNA